MIANDCFVANDCIQENDCFVAKKDKWCSAAYYWLGGLNEGVGLNDGQDEKIKNWEDGKDYKDYKDYKA